MNLGTIEEEAAACRAAFAGVGVGALAWCIHHGIELEILVEPPEARIEYILTSKVSAERALRLHEMRPVLGKLPIAVVKAYADYDKAYADYVKAYADYDKADADYDKARADYDKARADCASEITALHQSEVPDTTWDGHSIGIAT